MSDRRQVLHMALSRDGKELELYMDGESGTWRLFIGPSFDCVDMTLQELREFAGDLQKVLADIDRDPDGYNAEVRKTWQ